MEAIGFVAGSGDAFRWVRNNKIRRYGPFEEGPHGLTEIVRGERRCLSRSTPAEMVFLVILPYGVAPAVLANMLVNIPALALRCLESEHLLGEEGGAPKRPKPDHVPELFDQGWIMRDFECLCHMRLDIIGGPRTLRGGFRQAGSFCHRAATPTPKMPGRLTGFLQNTAHFSGG
jgi:hypothetical protein